MRKPFIAAISFILLFSFVLYLSGYYRLLTFKSRTKDIEWKGYITSPLSEYKYPTQGLTIAGNNILLVVIIDKRISRVYELNKGTCRVHAYFDMPAEASHTGGLAWDGSNIWAVDNVSNKAYYIDYDSSFNLNKAQILFSFDTSLNNTSACEYIDYNNMSILAISDFTDKRETIFVDINKVKEFGMTENCIINSYHNEGFSQGLAVIDNVLFESENKIYKGIINAYRLDALINEGNSKEAFLYQILSPGRGPQDLCTDDNSLWITDSIDHKLYNAIIKN